MMLRIKAERVVLGMTQTDLAKKMNVQMRTVQRWEDGTTDMPVSRLCGLADFFGCTTDWLLGRSESRK
jgi:transcriptional regulator with XRE-family HTH domain